MTFGDELNQQYKGYTICGRAQAVHIGRGRYCAHASVLLTRPKVCVEVYRDYDRFLNFDNEDEAQIVGLFLAELAVDHFVPPPAYYLTPMNIGWAVDILRRAADECKTREIRRPKLYEALEFLEQTIEPKWLVKRYGRELSGAGATIGKKTRSVKLLRTATRGIQQACATLLLDKLNELAIHFRGNKSEIRPFALATRRRTASHSAVKKA
jgi:hypothetical protein